MILPAVGIDVAGNTPNIHLGGSGFTAPGNRDGFGKVVGVPREVGDDLQCQDEGVPQKAPGKGKAPQSRFCGRHAQAGCDRQRRSARP